MMTVQIVEQIVPRGKKGNTTTNVIYAEVPVWLKNAVEDEVILAKRSGAVESLTSFTEEALKLLVNNRRSERGLPPIEDPEAE